jgi:hypothetical protein
MKMVSRYILSQCYVLFYHGDNLTYYEDGKQTLGWAEYKWWHNGSIVPLRGNKNTFTLEKSVAGTIQSAEPRSPSIKVIKSREKVELRYDNCSTDPKYRCFVGGYCDVFERDHGVNPLEIVAFYGREYGRDESAKQ